MSLLEKSEDIFNLLITFLFFIHILYSFMYFIIIFLLERSTENKWSKNWLEFFRYESFYRKPGEHIWEFFSYSCNVSIS